MALALTHAFHQDLCVFVLVVPHTHNEELEGDRLVSWQWKAVGATPVTGGGGELVSLEFEHYRLRLGSLKVPNL